MDFAKDGGKNDFGVHCRCWGHIYMAVGGGREDDMLLPNTLIDEEVFDSILLYLQPLCPLLPPLYSFFSLWWGVSLLPEPICDLA